MNKAQILALVLLIGRLIGVYFLHKTLLIQMRLLKLPIKDDDDGQIRSFRKTLNYMTRAVLAGQFIPIAMDAYVVVNGERDVPYWLGVTYAVSNCLTALLAAILIWKIYQLAANPKAVEQLEREATTKRKK